MPWTPDSVVWNVIFRRLNIVLGRFLFSDSDVWIYGFRRLNWFIWNQRGNRLKSAYFRRLDSRIQTSEFCLWKIFIFQIQTSESLISDVWIITILPIFLFAWEFQFKSIHDDPICCYHLLWLWWLLFRDFWISISMDSLSVSLDFIHVFECEFYWLIVLTIFFVICHFKNIKVFYTSSKYQNSFFKWFQHYFITKLVFSNRLLMYYYIQTFTSLVWEI